ncbi:hypothetical protein HK405_014240 [Cladochytrium tenue]|nr:hypothetical protein HK405_014240 [Cladochytrium tenue]
MGWDGFCVLSGQRAGGGPDRLLSIPFFGGHDDDDAKLRAWRADWAATIWRRVAECDPGLATANDQATASEASLTGLLHRLPRHDQLQWLLAQAAKARNTGSHQVPEARPFVWNYNEYVAIGHFFANELPADGRSAEEYAADLSDKVPASGATADVLLVADPNEEHGGKFQKVLEETRPGIIHEDIFERVEGLDEMVHINCSLLPQNHGNMFAIRAVYHYFEFWLRSEALPQRDPSVHETLGPLSFSRELFELVNSRRGRRCWDSKRKDILSGVDYFGLQSLMDGSFHADLHRAFSSAKMLAKVARRSGSHRNICMALLWDFRAWLSDASATPGPSFLLSFPIDLWRRVIHLLPLGSVLLLDQLNASSRSVLADIASDVIRQRVLAPTGDLRWVLPVPHVDDTLRAYAAAASWLPRPRQMDWTPDEDQHGPFGHTDFPFLDFLRACASSLSMRSRRRYWDIYVQFRRMWSDYRRHGFERRPDFAQLYVPANYAARGAWDKWSNSID